MKKLVIVIVCLFAFYRSAIAQEHLECFIIDDKEICLTHIEMLQLIEEFSIILQHVKK